MEFAFGFMNLTPDVFWAMTRREFSNLIKGYSKKIEDEDRKADVRARAIAYTVYVTTPKDKGKSNMSIEAFWGLRKYTEQEKEELKEKRKRAQEMFPKKICLPESR